MYPENEIDPNPDLEEDRLVRREMAEARWAEEVPIRAAERAAALTKAEAVALAKGFPRLIWPLDGSEGPQWVAEGLLKVIEDAAIARQRLIDIADGQGGLDWLFRVVTDARIMKEELSDAECQAMDEAAYAGHDYPEPTDHELLVNFCHRAGYCVLVRDGHAYARSNTKPAVSHVAEIAWVVELFGDDLLSFGPDDIGAMFYVPTTKAAGAKMRLLITGRCRMTLAELTALLQKGFDAGPN